MAIDAMYAPPTEVCVFKVPWLKKEARQQPKDIFKVGDVYFWGDQDGHVERELKTKLRGISSFKFVSEAYLMRVRYPGSDTEHVVLCLVADQGRHKEIIDQVGEEFRRVFRVSESLDTIFLSKDQQDRARSIGKAFYRKAR